MNSFLLIKQVLTGSIFLIGCNLLAQPFTEQTGIVLEPMSYGSVAWGDYDRDGDLDLLMTGSKYPGAYETSSIYRNNGNNTFTLMTGILLTGVTNGDADWGDYDNDGNPDIILTGSSYSGIVTKIYRNNGNSTFTEQTGIALTGVWMGTVSWCDYDLDGDLDILLTGRTQTSNISKIYRNNGNNTFTEQTGIELEGVAYSATDWGDYDNDGDPDLLLTGNNNSNGRISKIYRNNGDNTFTDQTRIYLTGVLYGSCDWGDYDNDGDLDILLTGGTSFGRASLIYRNEGNSLFVQQTGISLTAVSNGSSTWSDFDNDGDLDIMLTGYNADASDRIIKFYSNNGNNSFIERTDILLPGLESCTVAWGDYDNDNDLDIVLTGVAEVDHVSRIYKNETSMTDLMPSTPSGLKSTWNGGEITFRWNRCSDNNTPQKAINYNIRIGITSGGNEVKPSHALSSGKLLVNEINNLISDTSITYRLPLTRYYWTVQALDNSKMAGAFAIEQPTPTDTIQASELKAVIKSSSSLLIRWTNGNGLRRILFGRISSTSARANPVNGKDYKAEPHCGDGDQIGNTGWYCMYNGKADSAIVYGLGEGYSYDFQVVEYIETEGLPMYFKSDGTGNPGIFGSSIYSRQTGITMSEVTTSAVAWGDLDNDGYLDIVNSGHIGFSNAFSKAYRNNGNNTFTEQAGIIFQDHHYVTDIGDYDNDADLDILLINSEHIINENFTVFRNNGNNTFTTQTPVALGYTVSSSASGDYNNDGYLDILMTGKVSNTPVAKIYRNNGNNEFTEQTDIVLTGVYEGATAWGDYNNDGHLDFVLTGRISSSQWITRIFKNNGDESFSEQTGIYLNGTYSSSVAWGDYDNDSDLDLLLAGSANSYYLARIYRNNGDNTFTWQSDISLPPVNQCNVAWGDYNNDGYLDILMTGYSSSSGAISRIYRNNGNNTFSQATGISLIGASNSDCGWGDYDNDGDLDIMIGSTVYCNNLFMKAGSYPANKKPAAPSLHSSVAQPDGTILSWTPVRTDETYYKALSYNLKVGTTSGGDDILPANADRTTGYRRQAIMGNAQEDTTHLMRGLASGHYFWSVQAVDQSYSGGEWSSEGSFEVRNVQAFFSADEACNGLPTHFTDQSVATDGIAAWHWDFRDGDTSSLQNPFHTFSSSGIYYVMLAVTSTTGIKDTLEMTISVKPKPFTDFTAPATCQGTTTNITNTTNNNGLTINSWLWDFGDGETSDLFQPPAHGYINARDFQVKLRAIATNGCADSLVKQVIVGKIPNNKIGLDFGSKNMCSGDSSRLLVESSAEYSYQWRKDGINLAKDTLNALLVKDKGDFSVEITNRLGNCQVTSDTIGFNMLEAPPIMSVTSGADTVICQGERVYLEVPYNADYSYDWKYNGNSLNATNNYVYAEKEGSYAAEVSNGTCSTISQSKQVVYKPGLPKPMLTAYGPNVWYFVCSTEDAQAYRWYYNGNLVAENQKSLYYAGNNLGEYFVEVNDGGECYVPSDKVVIPVVPTGIDDLPAENKLFLYPNPASGSIRVLYSGFYRGDVLIRIVSAGGGIAKEYPVQKDHADLSEELDLTGFESGLYILELLTDDCAVRSTFIVIE